MKSKVIDIKPEPKPRMTRRDKWAKRPVVQRYYAFCDELRLKLPKFEVPGKLELTFHVPMFKSWPKYKQEDLEGEPHQQTPDIDNYIKAFLDALTDDDSHVYSVKGEKYWCKLGEGKIEVTIPD